MILSELWYNRYMKRNYRRTKATVSMINYHFVFCPRYRRRLFLVDGLETRFKELVAQICEQNGIVILAMECHIDHCHLFVVVTFWGLDTPSLKSCLARGETPFGGCT